jgi:urate oxidase
MSQGFALVDHRYGKTGVRLLRIDRSEAPHRLFEATVEIRLEGDFAETYTLGDNARVLPTDTMKNTVYALAREAMIATGEGFALRLAQHFVTTQSQVERAIVDVAERPWVRMEGRPDAFVAGGEERATCRVAVDRNGTSVRSGIVGLTLLKTARSAFHGFPRDRYTTLRETHDRLFSTRLEASWDYAPSGASREIDYAAARQRVTSALLASFAEHDSLAVQQTLHAMGIAALAAVPEVGRIHLRMPNKHYLLTDLAPFGLDNPNLVFLPTDEPAGMIEGTLERQA